MLVYWRVVTFFFERTTSVFSFLMMNKNTGFLCYWDGKPDCSWVGCFIFFCVEGGQPLKWGDDPKWPGYFARRVETTEQTEMCNRKQWICVGDVQTFVFQHHEDMSQWMSIRGQHFFWLQSSIPAQHHLKRALAGTPPPPMCTIKCHGFLSMPPKTNRVKFAEGALLLCGDLLKWKNYRIIQNHTTSMNMYVLFWRHQCAWIESIYRFDLFGGLRSLLLL